MSWATYAIDKLLKKEGVVINPRGNSMTPKIESGDRVELIPCDIADVQVDDVVLCRVKGSDYLHLVKAVGDGEVLIGNNHGKINGWTRKVYGKVVKIG